MTADELRLAHEARERLIARLVRDLARATGRTEEAMHAHYTDTEEN